MMGAETNTDTYVLWVKWGNEPKGRILYRDEAHANEHWPRMRQLTVTGNQFGWVSLHKNGQPIRYAQTPGYGPILDRRAQESA